MPTPMSFAGSSLHVNVILGGWWTVAVCGSMVEPQQGGDGKRGAAARTLRRSLACVEACDERSEPGDVTSTKAKRGGVNLQQEVAPHRTERPPPRLPEGILAAVSPTGKRTYKPTGAAFRFYNVNGSQRPRQVSGVVRRRA